MGDAKRLRCVRCSSAMEKATFHELEVDLCPSCGGLWLDRGEITRASRLPETELARLRGLLGSGPEPPPVATPPHTPCPSCTGRLLEVMMGPVHVDYCEACRGIFLDRDELDDAVQAARAFDRKTTPRQVVEAAISKAK